MLFNEIIKYYFALQPLQATETKVANAVYVDNIRFIPSTPSRGMTLAVLVPSL